MYDNTVHSNIFYKSDKCNMFINKKGTFSLHLNDQKFKEKHEFVKDFNYQQSMCNAILMFDRCKQITKPSKKAKSQQSTVTSQK